MLEVKRLGAKWWIVGDEESGPWGPYDTRAEAEADRRGVTRTIRNAHDRSFFTSDEREQDDEN